MELEALHQLQDSAQLHDMDIRRERHGYILMDFVSGKRVFLDEGEAEALKRLSGQAAVRVMRAFLQVKNALPEEVDEKTVFLRMHLFPHEVEEFANAVATQDGRANDGFHPVLLEAVLFLLEQSPLANREPNLSFGDRIGWGGDSEEWPTRDEVVASLLSEIGTGVVVKAVSPLSDLTQGKIKFTLERM